MQESLDQAAEIGYFDQTAEIGYNEQTAASDNTFLYVPNIIDYLRVVVLICAVLLVTKHPVLFFFMVGTSEVLDGIDGTLARKLDQCSKLGYALDFAIDRATEVFAYIILCIFCPQYWMIWLTILCLDITSHFLYQQANILEGNASHKFTKHKRHSLLELYYRNPKILFLTCFLEEVSCGFIYLYHFYPHSLLVLALIYLTVPFIALRAIILLLHIADACKILGADST